MDTGIRTYRAAVVLLTAALLATLTGALTGGQRADAVDGPVEVVYVATGQNFPDALAGANLAATVGAPMLTVNPDLPIPDPTITALEALDPDQIIILGGPVAVSDAVADALAAYTRSGAVARIEGGDRHDTAAQIADALPDKVHDADLLDGLDASAFLRSNATIDADTLDGFGHDELRSVPLPWPTYLYGVAQPSTDGVFLPHAGDSNVPFVVRLPDDRRRGDPIHVDVTLDVSGTDACHLALYGLGTRYQATGQSQQGTWPMSPATTVNGQPHLSVDDDRLVSVRFTAPPAAPDELDGPGDPIRLIFIRFGDAAADDCGVASIVGATLVY